MRKTTRFYMATQAAREIVHPFGLRDCLASLKREGLISKFKIGSDLILIESETQKPFEIASLFHEKEEFLITHKPKKTPH